MKQIFIPIILAAFIVQPINSVAQKFEIDVFKTNKGHLQVHFIGHGSLMFKTKDKVIYIDPSSREADYSQLPKADMIFVTHHHGDHCDPKAFEAVYQESTKSFTSLLAHDVLGKGMVLDNGSVETIGGVKIETIPAYNIVHKRDDGRFYHEKGYCNSYVLTIDGLRIFVAGDTENTPEMKALKNIDIAFLPMNLPYTMTPEMVADAVKAFKPKVFYPYHYGRTNTQKIIELLEGEEKVDVRIRKM